MPLKVIGIRRSPGVPEDHESQGKPGRASQFLDHAPRREQDGEAHDEPKRQAANAHLNYECAETTLYADNWRLGAKDARDILGAEGGRADAIAVEPAVVAESTEEIPDRVMPRSGFGGRFPWHPAVRVSV